MDSTVIDNTRGQRGGTTDAQSFRHMELFIFTLELWGDYSGSQLCSTFPQ